ncbi:unnamed protein product [marine sediment metagenome]|uniref:Uncharacterized protein n=1 Tax=marine sediment metagenome TaxID=412755 RepID=X1SN39_9ZZZZ
MQDETVKALAAMLCVTALEIVALLSGVNGAILSLTVGALAGLGGYALGKRL